MTFNKSFKNKINRALQTLTNNKYFDGIPTDEFEKIFKSFELNTEFLEGIYCGRQGQTNQQVESNLYWNMSWYKMESGRYEIVSYVS